MKKLLSTTITTAILVGFLALTFSYGVSIGEQHPKVITVRGVTNTENPSANIDFTDFWDAWETVKENFLGSDKLKNKGLLYGAISGLVSSLDDPYSTFLDPANSKTFQEDVSGSFSGIGAEIGIRDNRLVIVTPLKGTPAEQAGIMAGDHIMKIDDLLTDGISIEEAVNNIRGPRGTTVTLLIDRESWDEPRDVPIVRNTVDIPALEFEMLDGNVAYIQLFNFYGKSGNIFAQTALSALFSGAKGVILDLRNNPGGFLEVAVDIAGWFMPPNSLVVSEQSRTGITREFRSRGSGFLSEIPVVVLVNEGSASASEILAGAMRANHKTPLIGTQTFGKGTVQTLYEVGDGIIKLTVARWVLPNGEVLDGEGLVPDIEVEVTEEDLKAERDPQLEKAIGTIKSML